MGVLEFLVGIKCDICGRRKGKNELSRGCSHCGRTVCRECAAYSDSRLCSLCRKELGRE